MGCNDFIQPRLYAGIPRFCSLCLAHATVPRTIGCHWTNCYVWSLRDRTEEPFLPHPDSHGHVLGTTGLSRRSRTVFDILLFARRCIAGVVVDFVAGKPAFARPVSGKLTVVLRWELAGRAQLGLSRHFPPQQTTIHTAARDDQKKNSGDKPCHNGVTRLQPAIPFWGCGFTNSLIMP